MKVLTVSGSTSRTSTNSRFLKAMALESDTIQFQHFDQTSSLPLFQLDNDHAPYDPAITVWREAVDLADAVIISTPAYLKNIPAILKNALEWLSSSGQLQAKPVIALTLTPHPPRGSETIQSLLWSLQALEAQILVQMSFYQNEFTINEVGRIQGAEVVAAIQEMFGLLPVY